ncbi:hypothetical protein Bca4012_078486 [Brassica carinata]|uniref:Sulfotransferase n=2 Tax=Brassica oleracea TaxID=3712 RepID=A0A0D3DAP6_BRAOL|nr:unnamed protein product [Brassica oleracea]
MLSYWKGSLDDKVNVLFMSLCNLSNLETNKNGTTRIGVDTNVFFRKGEVGDWKNHLIPPMAITIDEVVEGKLPGSGLIFQ